MLTVLLSQKFCCLFGEIVCARAVESVKAIVHFLQYAKKLIFYCHSIFGNYFFWGAIHADSKNMLVANAVFFL
jgi:hypothetical protein